MDIKLNELYLGRLKATRRHISNVQDNAGILAEKLIEQKGECELARQLLVNVMSHDQSKLSGIEWDYLLSDDIEKLKLAITQHNRTNFHHPEYWNGINNMPEIFIAEMVCDWKSRSEELGTDFMKWVETDAPIRYSPNVKTQKKIRHYAQLLLGQGFKILK